MEDGRKWKTQKCSFLLSIVSKIMETCAVKHNILLKRITPKGIKRLAFSSVGGSAKDFLLITTKGFYGL